MGVVHKVKRAAAAFESQMAASNPSPVASSPSASVSKYPRFGKRGAPQAFPSKLYEILEGENPDIVGWTSTGRGFEVRDHARLSSEVLGRFFKQDKFSSFQRQLNLYGFRKITKGSEAGSYQHPHFRRGERTTLLTIRRSTKASPARLVPSSPASHPPPPAIPYNSMAAERPRSATPSPPPAPVSRGVLPWPRAPAQAAPLRTDARGVSPDSARSICGGGGGGGGPAQGRVSGGEAPIDRHGDRGGAWTGGGGGGGWGYAQCIGSHSAGSGEGWANAANHVQNGGGSGNGWKEEEMRPSSSAQVTGSRGGAPTAYSGGGGQQGSQGGQQGSQWEEEGPKKERGRAQGLDHQDVEVVGLLQRMAKDAQDSPSRKQAAPSAKVEGGHAQEPVAVAVAPPAASSHGHTHFRMPRPSSAGSGPAGPEVSPQGQQMVFAERLYDILNPDHSGKTPPSYYPFGFGADGRPTTLPPPPHHPHPHPDPHHLPSHHHHPSLPPPFPLAATPSDGSRGSRGPCFDAVSDAHRAGGAGGGGEISEYDRRAAILARSRSRSAERERGEGAYTHTHQQQQQQQQQQQHRQQQENNSNFDSSRSVGGGGGGGRGRGAGAGGGGRGYPYEGGFRSGPSQNGSPLPRFNFDRHGNGKEHTGGSTGGADVGDRRGSPEVARFHRPSWSGPECSYAAAAASSMVGKYQGEKGGSVGRSVVKAEEAWAPHRPFEAGRRVVN